MGDGLDVCLGIAMAFGELGTTYGDMINLYHNIELNLMAIFYRIPSSQVVPRSET